MFYVENAKTNANIIKKVNFSFFFSDCYVPNPKLLNCMQSLQYEEIKRPYQKSVFWVFFSMLSTKTINNKELTSIWGSKTKLLKTCLLSVLRRKTLKRMQTNQYKKKKITKKVYFECFWAYYLQKTQKSDGKHSILGNKRTLQEKYIMSVL